MQQFWLKQAMKAIFDIFYIFEDFQGREYSGPRLMIDHINKFLDYNPFLFDWTFSLVCSCQNLQTDNPKLELI